MFVRETQGTAATVATPVYRGLGSLRASTTPGAASSEAQVGQVVSVQVIPRPHDGLSVLGKWLQ